MMWLPRIIITAGLMLPLLLSSCMVGPNYHPPTPPEISSYTGLDQPTKTASVSGLGSAGKIQYFDRQTDLPGAWWELFHSPKINRLIMKGLKNSPNLAVAKATLINAQQTLNAQIGSTMLPALSGSLGGSRQLINNSGNPLINNNNSSIFNLFNASVNVAYTLDFFGGLRRQIAVTQAQVDYQAFQLEAAYLTLTSNIVTTAITIASIQAQIDATLSLIKDQRQQLNIIKRQYQYGGVSSLNIYQQQTLLAATEASLPLLKQQLAANKHALSVLIGEPPNEKDLLFAIDLQQLRLPQHLPVSVPSALVRQRPDIRAAEALMSGASANIGVAVANMYPQISLTGSYGWSAPYFPELFTPGFAIWNWGAAITTPIFNGESLIAKKRAAVATYQSTYAQYKQTVLQAFQNVADSLRALENDAQNLRALRVAENSAKGAMELAKSQYHLGGTSYLNVLATMQQYQQVRIQRIVAQTNRYTDTVALYQALGGGWWRRPCLDRNVDLVNNVAQYR